MNKRTDWLKSYGAFADRVDVNELEDWAGEQEEMWVLLALAARLFWREESDE